MYFGKSSCCKAPILRKKCDLGLEIEDVFIHMVSHMPELSVCIKYANFELIFISAY